MKNLLFISTLFLGVQSFAQSNEVMYEREFAYIQNTYKILCKALQNCREIQQLNLNYPGLSEWEPFKNYNCNTNDSKDLEYTVEYIVDRLPEELKRTKKQALPAINTIRLADNCYAEQLRIQKMWEENPQKYPPSERTLDKITSLYKENCIKYGYWKAELLNAKST